MMAALVEVLQSPIRAAVDLCIDCQASHPSVPPASLARRNKLVAIRECCSWHQQALSARTMSDRSSCT